MIRGRSPLRVGIISANWGAATHLPAWRTLADVEVVAICTSRPETAEKAAQDHGIARSFSDYRQMCADPEIDIIDVGTRPRMRQEMVAAALAGGKHVINQLPFAMDAAAAEKMVCAAAPGQVGAVAASVVGLPQLRLMKKMIEAGEVGDVYQVHCSWQMCYFNPIHPLFDYLWFGEEGLGVSALRNHGSHMLHALVDLFGQVVSVVGQSDTFMQQWDLPNGEPFKPQTIDTTSALLRFANGAQGSLITSWVAVDSPGFRIEVFGSTGHLRLESTGYPNCGVARLWAAKPNLAMLPTAKEVPVPDTLLIIDGNRLPTEPGSQVASMAHIFASVRDAIHGGAPPLASFAKALHVQKVIEAIHQSEIDGAFAQL